MQSTMATMIKKNKIINKQRAHDNNDNKMTKNDNNEQTMTTMITTS